MPLLGQICEGLDEFAPPTLAEEWDNVGLLAGDPESEVSRLMTCLTITPETAAEAVEKQADLIVTHHPLPFRAIKRIVTDSVAGRLLWQLITHRIAIYSPHTAFDSTVCGINQCLAEGVGLDEIRPLVSMPDAPLGAGGGRVGRLSQKLTLAEMGRRLRQFVGGNRMQYVGSLESSIETVAVACGAAGEFLDAAATVGCDLLILGETNLHTCIEAKALGVALLLPGHHASERFAIERLADVLAARYPSMEIWASERESDPVQLL